MSLTILKGLVSGDCSVLSTVVLQNNLLERSTVSLYNGCFAYSQGGPPTYYDNPLALTARNNLFWQSTVALTYNNSWPAAGCFPAWSITDNLFDTSTNSLASDVVLTNYVSLWNNAFFGIANSLGGTTNLSVTSLSYAAGPLGTWYVSSASPTLVDVGSRSADLAGLYHYTIQTNLVDGYEIKEYNSTVDIGYHYVAVDGNGNPIDTNGNGVPDYLEDPYATGQFSITLIAPTNSTFYAEPATIPMQASVTGWSNLVTSVDFFRGSTHIVGTANAPYQYSWPIVAAGAYSLTAVAHDVNSLSVTSTVVNITVTNFCGSY
jgi:hypothetical protein